MIARPLEGSPQSELDPDEEERDHEHDRREQAELQDLKWKDAPAGAEARDAVGREDPDE